MGLVLLACSGRAASAQEAPPGYVEPSTPAASLPSSGDGIDKPINFSAEDSLVIRFDSEAPLVSPMTNPA